MDSGSEAAPLMLGMRGTGGVQMMYGPPKSNQPVEFFNNQKIDSRFMVFSSRGKYVVYHTPTGVQLTDIANKETLDLGPGTVLVREAAFSPQEGYLVLWDAPAKKEDNSCTVYDLKTRTVKAIYAQTETTWKVRWSNDEHLLFLMGRDLTYVFDEPEFSNPVNQPKAKIAELSVSPAATQPYYVAVFNPSKSTPGFVRLYRYPNIDDPATALAARAMVKEDQVIFKWNVQGTHVLFNAWSELDERSYYGSSSLYLMNTSCDSMIIGLNKEGPVHSWDWNPKGESFCVIYGFMPGMTCVFNKKGDRVHTFDGSQYRNGLLYNPFGNLLVLYGHGNIRGAFEIWDIDEMKKICSQDAEYMTYIEWAPDGQTLLMATTSPRLKVGNKYQLWHYTGKNLLDQPYAGELFQICWRGAVPGTYKAPNPSSELGKNFTVNEAKKATAYVPPSMRNRTIVGLAPEAGASVHFANQSLANAEAVRSGPRANIPGLVVEEDKKKPKKKKKPKAEFGEKPAGATDEEHSGVPRSAPQNIRSDRRGSGFHPSSVGSDGHGFHQGSPSSYPNRNPHHRYPRRPSLKTPDNRPRSGHSESTDQNHPVSSSPNQNNQRMQRPVRQERQPLPKPAGSPERAGDSDGDENRVSSGDPTKDKQVSRLKKKIAEINSLKQEQAAGKVLEKNQLEKIKRMDSITKELEKLQLSAILKKK